MDTKKLYIIRHGETDYNKAGIVQGSGIDSSLNETGFNQAEMFYNKYKNISFDKVYTSQLVRTHQSVKSFLDSGIEHQILPGLNEINWGIKEGEKVSFELDSYYMKVAQAWRSGKLSEALEGGESPLDVQKRQVEALNQILNNKKEKTILICMHGRAMRIFMSLLLNTDMKLMDEYEHSNLCLYQLELNQGVFNLISRNNTSHLN